MIKKTDHFVITTGCMERCLEFYEALGFHAHDAKGRYELTAGDFKINIHYQGRELSPKAGHVMPGSADLCFEIDIPLEACIAILKGKRIPLELGPVIRNGVYGSMASIYLRDPDKNLVELCSYEE